MECVFCKIVSKEIPADVVYEDENYIAFKDINPKAPIHILIIPKQHIESFHLINSEEELKLIEGMIDIAWKIVKKLSLNGCQLHINSGKNHGQEVMHVHLHLISGGKLSIKW